MLAALAAVLEVISQLRCVLVHARSDVAHLAHSGLLFRRSCNHVALSMIQPIIPRRRARPRAGVSLSSLVQRGVRVVVRQACVFRVPSRRLPARHSTLSLLVAANVRLNLLLEEGRGLVRVDKGRHLVALPVDLVNLGLRLTERWLPLLGLAQLALEVAVPHHDIIHLLHSGVFGTASPVVFFLDRVSVRKARGHLVAV